MSPSVGLLIFSLRALSLVNAENHERVNVLFEKNTDADGEVFEKIYKGHHAHPQGFACFKGNVTDESNIVYFNLRHYPIRPGEVDRVKAEIHLKIIDPPSEHAFLLSVYDAMTKKKVAQTRVIPGVTRKWIVLDVADIVRHWLRHPKRNSGVTAVYEVAGPTQFPIGENRSKVGLPLLVIYREYYQVPPRHAGRNRRSSEQPLAKEKVSSHPAAEKLACSRRDMHVNTRQLLGDWVIQPVTFNAYDCTGKCESPFNGRLRRRFTKNHAYLQYLNYLARNNSKPAEFCCVPSALKSLQILYYDQTGKNFVMRDLRDMIVTKCTCALKNTDYQVA